MSYKARTLFRLIEDINSSLFLPHIQRPFVWDEEQMQRLLDSLMRNYPIQTLLFWRTKNEIKARRFMDTIAWDIDLHDYYDRAKSAADVEKVFVLDGQQRLQTLYALFSGCVMSANGEVPREVYIDITTGHTPDDTGLLYNIGFFAEQPGLPWYRLRNLLGKDSQKTPDQIYDELNDALDKLLDKDKEQPRARERQVQRNIIQLVSILREERHFWVQELDGVANDYTYQRVLDIFVRVNSGGTKLDAADLMFAAMKAEWSEIEENVEEIVDLLNDGRLSFDKNLVLKCIIVAMGRGAELQPTKFTDKDGAALLKDVQENWPRLEGAFEQLRDFVLHELQLYSDKVIRSYNSFVPIFDYLYHNPKPNERSRQLMRGYYYKSQLFNWYGARTDQIINALHRSVGQMNLPEFPLVEIKGRLRGATMELGREHLDEARLRFILLNLIYVDQFGRGPFNVQFKGNAPHIDHIYPQSMLRRLQVPSEEIHSLGNFRFVGATDNIRKRAELPDKYFARLKRDGINIKGHLMLEEEANDPSLLKFDIPTYRQFRRRRLDAIYNIAHRIVNPELA